MQLYLKIRNRWLIYRDTSAVIKALFCGISTTDDNSATCNCDIC